jgi:hypothetical protein
VGIDVAVGVGDGVVVGVLVGIVVAVGVIVGVVVKVGSVVLVSVGVDIDGVVVSNAVSVGVIDWAGVLVQFASVSGSHASADDALQTSQSTRTSRNKRINFTAILSNLV